jgi:hypothetical protein
MRVDLLKPEQWEDLNDQIKTLLPAEPSSLRVFRGLAHAVFEITFGAAIYFDHKKNCGMVKGNAAAFIDLLPFLYKDGYQVQFLPYQELRDAKTWVESLKKDTNFVLFAEDHPVTAELYDWQELDELLNEKKIFSIRLSHHSWLAEPAQLGAYSIRICSLSPDYALALTGARFKVPPFVSHKMSWQANEVISQFEFAKKSFFEDRQAVTEFEENLPDGWQKLPVSGKRLFDRALIYHPALNGEAIQTALRAGGALGSHIEIESLSLQRWQSLLRFQDWWDPSPTSEQIRGLLLVSAALLKKKDFQKALSKAGEECRI